MLTILVNNAESNLTVTKAVDVDIILLDDSDEADDNSTTLATSAHMPVKHTVVGHTRNTNKHVLVKHTVVGHTRNTNMEKTWHVRF